MKYHTLLSLSLCFFALSAFAQKKDIDAAKVHLQNKEYAKAEAIINTTIAAKKGNKSKEAWTVRGDIYTGLVNSKNKSSDAQLAYDSYVQAESLGKPGDCKDQMINLINACLNKGYLQERKGNYSEAIELYRIGDKATMSIDPKNAQGKFRMASCFFKAEKFDESIEQFQQCIANDYELSASYYGIDNNYQMDYKYTVDMRISNIEEALTKLPKDERILSVASDVYTTNSDFAKAEEVSNKMIELYPQSPNSYFALGNAMFEAFKDAIQTGDREQAQIYFDKASKSYEKANELFPNSQNIEYSLGNLYYQRSTLIQQEINELGFSDEDIKKQEALTEQSHSYLKKALPFLESAYFDDQAENLPVKSALKHIYLTFEMTEQYKILIAE